MGVIVAPPAPRGKADQPLLKGTESDKIYLSATETRLRTG